MATDAWKLSPVCQSETPYFFSSSSTNSNSFSTVTWNTFTMSCHFIHAFLMKQPPRGAGAADYEGEIVFGSLFNYP